MPKLNDKQQKFCECYALSLNATEAAIKAGYSERSAYSIGFDLLNKPEIQQEISRLQAKTSEKLSISHDDVTRRLKTWIESDISELITLTPEEIKELPLEVRQLIQGYKPTKYGFQLDFVSKERALDMVNRHIGYYEVDNLQKNSELSASERQELIKRIEDRKKRLSEE